jgi:hypothetical protein
VNFYFKRHCVGCYPDSRAEVLKWKILTAFISLGLYIAILGMKDQLGFK